MNLRIPSTAVLLLLASPALAEDASIPRAQVPTPAPVQPLNWNRPADLRHWHTEGVPIGNGRLGAMLFGGTDIDRIQFNEISLWGGANDFDGGYDLGDTGFGGYRNFGDISIAWGGADAPQFSSPSGHADGNGQGLLNTVDADANTKWCVENPGKAVVWQVELPAPRKAASYTLTSANDAPERDPRQWTVEGSQDGKAWKVLDRQTLTAPFEARGQAKTFAAAHPAACRFYRLTFVPPQGASHFQVAGIALDGVDFAAAKARAVPADYRMALNLATGLHRVAFTRADGVKIGREAFASRPDQVMVFRYTAGKKGALSGSLRLKPGQNGVGASPLPAGDGLVFSGALANKLRYGACLRVLHEGGKVAVKGDTLAFDKCDTLTLLLDARTDYKPSFADGWRSGADPLPQAEHGTEAAAGKAYADLQAAHAADFSRLMGACALDLGKSAPGTEALPMVERLRRYTDDGNFKKEAADPGLEAQLFQMGRYLLVSSSRPGGLPANLQGLWNDSNAPAWASDYHNNINVQMNYWPAETTGLGECALPLADYVAAQAPSCRTASRKAFGQNLRGWTARTSQSIFGGNGWDWNIPASAWYSLHLFEHYAFTQDKAYLEKTAYPILKETCQYWEDHLKRRADGLLVAPNGWSPEHGPREDGVMHDQQLIWELFDDYLKAAKALGVDADCQKKVAGMQAQLAPNKIGKWGQLQEWQADRDDPNDRHRHTSHLFALYPGRQISKTGTPQLAHAAMVSLMARCNDHGDKPWTPADMHPESIYGWVWPWRAAMWARLGEGDRAYQLVRGKVGNTAPNMLGLNVPYFKHRQELIQLDNSFGVTAAMAEMLLQSHAGEIHLLPALPSAWAAQGSFKGLCARGGYAVDCAWKNGKVTAFAVRRMSPDAAAKVKVRVNGKVVEADAE